MTERDYVKTEAKRLGLELSEDDLEVVLGKLTTTKAMLAKQRPSEIASLEPAYVFWLNVLRPDSEA